MSTGSPAAVEPLEPRLLLSNGPLITEFMASNGGGPGSLLDGNGASSDWIEIYNPTAETVSLEGWYLSDDADDLKQWRFPADPLIDTSLGPGEYMIVFASSREDAAWPYVDDGGYLHTNFSLKKSGEDVVLAEPGEGGEAVAVSVYEDYPQQTTDISYGLAQDIDVTQFVAAGAEVKYVIPDGDPGDWTNPAFVDDTWTAGTTGLGYADMVSGFAVRTYKANTSVSSLSVAESVIAAPGMQSAVYSANAAVFNYVNSGGAGHYVNDVNFPGFTGLQDGFAVEATGFVTIPTAGQWSFGVNSDDGFGLTLDDGTNTFAMSFPGLRSASDTIQTFDFPSAGVYSVRLVMFENGGGAAAEFFAAPGAHAVFDAGAFDLVGDTANGGLAVVSEPADGAGGGGGAGLGTLISTDVKTEMKDVNSSMFVRVPLTVADPQAIESLTLKMKYDDGYVAYLNGREIARSNAPALPIWSSNATAERTDTQASAWENVNVTDYIGDLVVGDNVLAVHGLNWASGDDDFLVLPELVEISYTGLGEHFFATATPGAANTEEYWLRVEDTKFDHDRGFYDEPFDLAITTATEGAAIYYTTDGSAPQEVPEHLYTAPLAIATTTVVRAMAVKDGHVSTDADTQTYLFLGDVLAQPANPEGFPSAWGSTAADYEMDGDVINNPLYQDQMIDSLLSLPTMSIVMDVDDLFGSSGIYTNSGGQGIAWERPTSVEWINTDGTTGFQVDAGVRIYGGAFRGMGLTRKKTFRLLFKDDYGPTKLDFDMFQTEGAAASFDTLILRGGANDGWNNWGRQNTQYIVDEFMRRTQLALGEPGSHGTYVHLYLNGLYWGLYNPVERTEASFSATYFGGEKEQWDALNSGAPTGESNTATWNAMLTQTRAGLQDMASYQKIQGNWPDGTNNPAYDDLLDMDNYITYMFSNFWGGTGDWPGHNWYSTCRRPPDSTGFKFFNWDSEGAIVIWSNLTANRTGVNNSLAEPYAQLRTNPEFQMLFADHAHRYLFNGGPATAGPSHARYEELANLVEKAIISESARWGDQASSSPYTQAHWETQKDYVLDTYMLQRPAVVLQQLKNAGLYPDTIAPSFDINGSYQHGGTVDLGDVLTIGEPDGTTYPPEITIYYTTDGTDPRALGGGAPNPADAYGGAVALYEATHVKARAYDASTGEWSALNEAVFYIDLAPDVRVTEIMYNPADPTAAEIALGFDDSDDFEYIEITNINPTDTLPLSGLRFGDGIQFTFGDVSIAPGEHVVAVKNAAAFAARYPAFPGTVAGHYTGSLQNTGERIQLDSPIGGIVQAFKYEDGWYDHTDGEGFSLTIRDPGGELGLWDLSDGWRSSAAPGGSPGTGDVLTDPGAVIITEVLAHSDTLAADAIELYNASASPVDISGWFLSDAGTDALGNDALTRYEVPAMAPLAPGQYVVFHEDLHFGVGATPFALDELGDDVYLSSNFGGVAGGYREHVDFGASPADVAIGLYAKSTGGTDFTLLAAPTLGGPNAGPYYEGLVISEFVYHPADPTASEQAAGFITDDAFEFVELYNRSTTATYALSDFRLSDGVGFTFGWCPAGGDPASSQAWTMEPGATATWSTALPAETYEVFARWDLLDGEGNERDLDGQASYTVTHAGGTTVAVRDQKPELLDEGPDYISPEGWVSLGTYAFDGPAQVVLTRGTNDPNNWTVADQLKFVPAGQPAVVVDTPLLDSWSAANAPATIGPGQRIVLVSDLGAFNARYDVAGESIIVGGAYTGNLSNNGEGVKLQRAGNAEPYPSYHVPWYRIDYVNYKDAPPWPVEGDGGGFSLIRAEGEPDMHYGNDPASWLAGAYLGTPGGANSPMDPTPPTVPTGVTALVGLTPTTQIELTWTPAADGESGVDHYVIHRDGLAVGTTAAASFIDTGVSPVTPYVYQVSAVNRDQFESERSADVAVTIPGVDIVDMPDTTTVRLYFTEPLVAAGAENAANYAFSGGPVSQATLQDPSTVALTVDPLRSGQAYTVTVASLATVSGLLMPDGQVVPFEYHVPSGSILREYWAGINGGSVADLTRAGAYPDSPTRRSIESAFEARANWTDNYGTRMRGYVHPPVSGMYTFYIAAADTARLFLSSDSGAAGAVLIASANGATGYRNWTAQASQRSAEVFLSAGMRYYIEAIHKEGGGNDYLSVGWQVDGGAIEGPIPGTALSPVVLAGVDATPPSTPAALTAQPAGSTEIDLNWAASVDAESGVAYYVVYRNGVEIATTTATGFTDTALVQTQSYTYIVTAVNGDHAESADVQTSPVSPAPSVSGASAAGATELRVTFGKAVTEATAEVASNYTVAIGGGGGIAVASALWNGGTQVTLTLADPLADMVIYTLSVTGVRDAAGTPVEPNAAIQFVYGGVHPNMLAWWTFDLDNGAISHDLTSNNRDLTVFGADWSPAGRIGGAFRFDGTSSNYLLDEDAESYINGVTAFTFAAWIKGDGLGTDKGFYYLRDPNGSDEYGFRHDAALQGQANQANGLRGGLRTTGGTQRWESLPNAQTTDWQHVAITWTSGQNAQVYLDGQPVAPGWISAAVAGSLRDTQRLFIGRGSQDGNGAWSGLIDDFRIYGAALAPAEVLALIDPRPSATADAYEVVEDSTLTVAAAGVLANDFDPDPGPSALTVELVDDVDHGTLDLHADGSFTYTPEALFTGDDSFTYRPFDGQDYGDAATVTITVLDAVRVVSADVTDAMHADLLFATTLDPLTAGDAANYVIDGGPAVQSAMPAGDGRTVTLTLSGAMNENQPYTLTITNVAEAGGGHVIPPGTQVTLEYVTWLGQDIGAVGAAGSHSQAGEAWTVVGSGVDIWSNADEFHYVYMPLEGDITLTARVASMTNTDAWAKVGVMIRETLDANSTHAMALVTPGNGAGVHTRRVTGQQTYYTMGPGTAPYWVRVVREGDVFKSYTSSDGQNWTLITTDTIVMSEPTVYMGPAVTSHNDGALCTAVFDNISIVAPDRVAPLADVANVTPDPRAEQVDDVRIAFTEPVTGLDVGDLSLTRDGSANLLTGAESLTSADGVTWTLGGLADLTAASGTYVLTLSATGSDIVDAAGNALAADAADTWQIALTGPVPDIVNVTPDPRNTAVDEIRIVFSESVTGLGLDDLSLTRDGGADLLGGAATLTSADQTTWTLAGLAPLTGADGTYTLTLHADGSNIVNGALEPMSIDASDSWLTDTHGPVGTMVDVDPDPRDMAVESVDIVFDEPVFGLDISDLVLTRNGGANLLTGSETLTTQDNLTWTLGGLGALTASDVLSGGFVAFNDHMAGNATHANTTTYAGNGAASGLLKDIATGLSTGVSIAITQNGTSFATNGALPAVATDAYNIFNGYVDFRSTGGSSLEISGNDHYTHAFSGLDAGSSVTYSFHGTAIRGNSSYTNRWTLVTLEGADGFTPDHSSGVGVVTAGLAPNQAAIWVGHNSAANQGFVAGWTDIDPGPDGTFSIVSRQYTGPTPGVGSGTANGSKGYGIAGLRLEEHAPSGAEGLYTLTINAAGSGITDALGNPPEADATGTFVIDTSAPTADVADVSPDPRSTAVDQVQIVFDEQVTGLDVADLTLTRDGGADLLTGAESLTSAYGVTWTLGDLAALTGQVGTYTLTLTAAGSGIRNALDYALADDASEAWTNALPSPAPSRPDLAPASDTGASDSDNLTALDNASADRTLEFLVGGTLAGATVTLYANGVAIGSAVAAGPDTTVITDGLAAHDLADAAHTITARQTEAGKAESPDSAELDVTVDTAAPGVEAFGLSSTAAGWTLGTIDSAAWTAGRSSQTAPWALIDRLLVIFDEPAIVPVGDMTVTGLDSGPIYPASVDGSGTARATCTMAACLDVDRYTVALAASVADVAGNALAGGGWTVDLNMVAGDINGDGRVSSRDRRELRDAYGSSHGTASYSIVADLNGDGRISSRDRRALRDGYGTALPAPPALPAPGAPDGETTLDEGATAAAMTPETAPSAPADPPPATEATPLPADIEQLSLPAVPTVTVSPSPAPAASQPSRPSAGAGDANGDHSPALLEPDLSPDLTDTLGQ